MLEKMGRNVFALAEGKDLAERCIDKIEDFYLSLDVATEFADYAGDKNENIEQIISQLQSHGMVALGENQASTLDRSREILQAAFN